MISENPSLLAKEEACRLANEAGRMLSSKRIHVRYNWGPEDCDDSPNLLALACYIQHTNDVLRAAAPEYQDIRSLLLLDDEPHAEAELFGTIADTADKITITLAKSALREVFDAMERVRTELDAAGYQITRKGDG